MAQRSSFRAAVLFGVLVSAGVAWLQWLPGWEAEGPRGRAVRPSGGGVPVVREDQPLAGLRDQGWAVGIGSVAASNAVTIEGVVYRLHGIDVDPDGRALLGSMASGVYIACREAGFDVGPTYHCVNARGQDFAYELIAHGRATVQPGGPIGLWVNQDLARKRREGRWARQDS